MKFSIVTISYNQGRFLEQAIRSVVEQDYPDVEYIVVDPGSADSSREIIEKYRDRISAVVYEPDYGPADGLNKGFVHATGEICGYLNADDYFAPDAFRRVARFFQKRPEVDVLCGAIRMIRHDGRSRLRTVIADKFNLERFVAGVCTVGQQGTFFRRTALPVNKGFNIENRTCWDAELLVDMALNGCRFAVMHKVLGNFRLHDASISGSGRLNEQYLNDLDRIRIRLAAANVRVNRVRGIAMRATHKANVLRHLRALAVR